MDLIPLGLQHSSQRGAHRCIIINHENDWSCGNHDSLFFLWGTENKNVIPRSSFRSNHSRPSWALRIDLQMASPIPMPPVLVVKKGSNTCSEALLAIPTPTSLTATVTVLLELYERSVSSRCSRGIASMASPPLVKRLRITCWS